MGLANTEDEYGLVARLFHWAVAVLILGLLPVGLFMGGMDNSPFKFEVYAMHKSFGMLVFFLGLGRILWRFISPPPDHLETHARWEVTLSSAAHFWLYVCMIGMPLSGWLMSSAGEFPVPFFGLQLPYLIGKDQALMGVFGQMHGILGYTLLFVLALHMAGALKHHVLDKDETLMRMAWRKEGFLLPALVVIVVGLSYAVSFYSVLGKAGSAGDSGGRPVAQAPAARASATDGLGEHGWAILPEISKLHFQAVLYNAPFTGEFGDFGGTIVFNPDDLSTAKADITVRLSDVATGDDSRDSNIVGPEWFDTAQFPVARYVTRHFEHAEGNRYVAVGDLTIRGQTMPLVIPFSLDIENGTAHMKADVELDRTSFGIGQGQWADESAIKHAVKVMIDLKAAQ